MAGTRSPAPGPGAAGAARALARPLPAEGEITLDGLDVSDEQMRELLRVDADGVREQLPQVEEFLAQFGDRLPAEIGEQLEALKRRLDA